MTFDKQSVPAAAKINLCLHVTGRREDGYHVLDSIVVFADAQAADRIEASPAPRDRFAVTGPFAAELARIDPADNLMLKARDWLRARGGKRAAAPISLHLEKRLPVASGLGGGSADAAAALRLMAAQWTIPIDTIAEDAVELGADVPMCLANTALRATGIGDLITAISGVPPLASVLVNPGIGVSTPAVFAALDKRDNPPIPDLPAQGFADTATLTRWLASHTRNDLQAPARRIAPIIGDVLAELEAHGALLARMSGSGPTCFGLFDTRRAAMVAAEALARPGWWVCSTSLNPQTPMTTQSKTHADA